MDLPPIRITNNINLFQFLIAFPWYLGVLCAPLYIYVVLFRIKKKSLHGLKLRLVDLSLKGAILASILGLESILAVVPVPFVMSSIFSSILVFKEYRSNRTQPMGIITATIFIVLLYWTWEFFIIGGLWFPYGIF